eukprot:CAMPEP_0202863910 /NCGR_PEP_ID=MMETSP1391-20130828/4355_1 /ASSEMBLY_ACC=CAM_ASM_000867 /TAXON_ID=1034604 /ORGANISM="Chlamydomonas leiostraca, Strain SAG 11-49" /LENGTH=124 /DNA_ID=CAMNT_0049543595 /DNA_START=87 /DNA_END=461 /DNA_ORIENTATION=+
MVNISELRPLAKGLDLTVKVLDAKVVLDKKGKDGASSKISECIVGDASGTVVFKARNDQAEKAQPGTYLKLSGAKVDMYRGSMRLEIDATGSVEVEEGASFQPNTDNNVSLIEFELVSVQAPDA